MTAHTPGPWKYDHKSGWIDSAGCCERGPMHVADIRGWGHLTGKGVQAMWERRALEKAA